jgi:carbonic anhydrase
MGQRQGQHIYGERDHVDVDVSCSSALGCTEDADPNGQPPDAIAALVRLCSGNARFIAGRCIHPGQDARHRAAVAQGQTPFAVVLGCVDSRVPPELVFDRGLGDLFVVRSAGQTLDGAVLGSIEFGVARLGIPLIVVLGHDNCGAVKATIDALSSGLDPTGTNIDALVNAIKPAVSVARDRHFTNLLEMSILYQISNVVAALGESRVLADAVAKGRLMIVGALYHFDSGSVAFGTPA